MIWYDIFYDLYTATAKFNVAWEERENLTLQDVKALVPLLFVQDNDLLPLSQLKILTESSGTEWNDSLTSVFDNNKTVSSSSSQPEGWVGIYVTVLVLWCFVYIPTGMTFVMIYAVQNANNKY